MKCPLTRLSSLPVILSEVSQVLSHLRISYQIFMRNILFLRVINKGGVKRDRRGFVVTFMAYERLVKKAMESQYYLIQSVFETKVGIDRTDVKKTQSNKQNKVYHFWCSWTLYRSKYHFVLRYILNYIHCSCTFEILTTSITRNGTNLILA